MSYPNLGNLEIGKETKRQSLDKYLKPFKQNRFLYDYINVSTILIIKDYDGSYEFKLSDNKNLKIKVFDSYIEKSKSNKDFIDGVTELGFFISFNISFLNHFNGMYEYISVLYNKPTKKYPKLVHDIKNTLIDAYGIDSNTIEIDRDDKLIGICNKNEELENIVKNLDVITMAFSKHDVNSSEISDSLNNATILESFRIRNLYQSVDGGKTFNYIRVDNSFCQLIFTHDEFIKGFKNGTIVRLN